MLWLRRATTGENNIWISFGADNSKVKGWSLGCAQNHIHVRFDDGTTRYLDDYSSIPIPTSGEWHHVVLTSNNTTDTNSIKVYIDGTLVRSFTPSSTLSTTTGSKIVIGLMTQ